MTSNNDILRWIRLEAYGPAFPRRDSALDIFRPEHRLYPPHHRADNLYDAPVDGASPEYRDIITTWRGLSIAQAHELLFWECAFKWCIEQHVEREVAAQFYASSDKISESFSVFNCRSESYRRFSLHIKCKAQDLAPDLTMIIRVHATNSSTEPNV